MRLRGVSEIGEVCGGLRFGMSTGARDYGGCGGYRLDCPSLCAEEQGDRLGKFIAVVQQMMMIWKGLKQ